MPVLFIVAGPNGSGKSLFSATLTQIPGVVFDGDKHLAVLKKSFPEIGSDRLLDHINDDIFSDAKKDAIDHRENFAFETNFSADDPLFSMREFKAAGYETHLVFIGLNTKEECIQRVTMRVNAGGHKVPEASIIHNFKTGYQNLFKYYQEFDRITLIDNPIADGNKVQVPKTLLKWRKDATLLEVGHLPEWAQKFFEKIGG